MVVETRNQSYSMYDIGQDYSAHVAAQELMNEQAESVTPWMGAVKVQASIVESTELMVDQAEKGQPWSGMTAIGEMLFDNKAREVIKTMVEERTSGTAVLIK